MLELDMSRLMREFRREEHLGFSLKGDFSRLPLNEEILGEVVRATDRAVGPDFPACSSQWLQTTAGWSATLRHGNDFDAAITWLQAFAEQPLWAIVTDGVISGGPRSRGHSLGLQPPTPVAFLAYATEDLTQIPLNDRWPRWAVDTATTRFLAEQALAWTYAPDAKVYLSRISGEVELVGLENIQGVADAIPATATRSSPPCASNRSARGRWRSLRTASPFTT